MMARTKRVRRSYGAGEWGRNRVRVFPDPKTGLFQIEWRENGRRLTRSLQHRDWRQAKTQADEFAAGFAGPELNGKKNAEPEPLTLGTLFDIYGEEVTPTKAEQTRPARQDRDEDVPPVLRTGPRPGNALPARLGPIHRRAARGKDRHLGQARVQQDDRVGPDVPDGGSQLGHEVEGRTGPPDARQESAQGPQEAQGEEPHTGPSSPKRSTKHCCRCPGRWTGRFHVALVLAHETGHRIGAIRKLRWSDIEFEAEVVRWRAKHEKTGYEHRTPVTEKALAALGGGASDERRDRRRAGAGRPDGCLSVRGPVARGFLVEESPEARRSGAETRPRLALAEAEIRLRPHGPAAQGALRTRRLEDGQDRPSVLPESGRGTAQTGAHEPPESWQLIQSAGTDWRESGQRIP